MKLLFVTQYFWPESFKINDLALLATERGCDVTVLTGQPNYPNGSVYKGYKALSVRRERHPDGYDIIRVPLLPRGRSSSMRLALNYVSFVFFASLLGPFLLRGMAFDGILVFGVSPILQAIPAILIGRMKRAPVTLWVQDLWPDSLDVTGHVKNARLLGMVAKAVSWIYRKSDLLLVSSPGFTEPVRALAGAARIELLLNPGDPELTAAPPGAATKLPQGFTVVYAGNVGQAQSPETLVEAAARMKDHTDIALVVFGGGSRWEWLRQEAEKRGLRNLHLMGRLPRDEIAVVLRNASVLVTLLSRGPALARTIPSRISSYMAAARPVVVSMDGEGGRLVEDAGAGVACPAEDPLALAEAIVKLRARPSAELDEMGRAARAFYDANFAPGMVADRLLALVKSMTRSDHASNTVR